MAYQKDQTFGLQQSCSLPAQPTLYQSLPIGQGYQLLDNNNVEHNQIALQEAQLEFLAKTLRDETFNHNHTRTSLETSRCDALRWERLLSQEKAQTRYLNELVHELQIKVQDAEIRRIEAEGKLEAERGNKQRTLQSPSTLFSDYRSATFSPSAIQETTKGKRRAECSASPTPKRRFRAVDHQPVAQGLETLNFTEW